MHNVETMFFVRETPWHGLGTRVEDAPSSADALVLAGLDWEVIQKPILTNDLMSIPGYKANIRSTDQKVLGVVSDRYKIVQNHEAFGFTDDLLGEGVRYETAGSLQEGRKVWLLARLPQRYQVVGDEVVPYLVFSNCHDGSGGIRAAMTPVRIVCNNTLNLALSTAKRMWSTIHTGDINKKLDEAKKTLLLAEFYMDKLTLEAESLSRISLTDRMVKEYIEMLIPMPEEATTIQENNVTLLRSGIHRSYYEATDLQDMPFSGWRFINAVSDFATHAKPLRQTANYKENMFAKTIDGNPFIDKAYEIIGNSR